jgi:hypothetical protein
MKPKTTKKKPPAFGHVDRHQRQADHVLLGTAGARPLRVLLVEDQDQVSGDQTQDQAGHQQDVQGEQPRDEVVAGEQPAEDEVRHVRADDRDRQDDALHDPQAGAGEQVVRQRVAAEALEQRQHEQREADQPVELARLAERAGEEDPEHVHHDRHHEHQRGPVVDLPHQQAAAHVERDVQGAGVRLGHPDAVQRRVRAVVDHVAVGRGEEQRQEDAGQQQHDEAVQRDLAQHEGPVVREDLAQLLLGRAGDAETLVEVVGGLPAERGRDDLLVCSRSAHPRSQKLGPTGWSKPR